MATYQELFDIRNDTTLHDKVTIASVIKAQTLLDGTPTQDEVDWAMVTLDDPNSRANQIMYYVLAANNAATVAQILAATDAAIQTNVDNAVDALTAGGS